MKLTPARRSIDAAALVCILIGAFERSREVHFLIVPDPAFASRATFAAVDQHSQQRRLFDDLTILAVRRLPPLPV